VGPAGRPNCAVISSGEAWRAFQESSARLLYIVTDQSQGLFPNPSEIKLACDCPDWAEMCKHIAAVLYGIGARLDHQPDLLFLLRNVDHEELITAELDIQAATSREGKRPRLAGADLSDVFGVEMDEPVKSNQKTSAIRKKPIRKSKKTFTPTAAAVAKIRKRFGMNTSQFAKLLGVSPPTISNWENGRGKLNLRQHTLAALTQVVEYTPEQAVKKLKRGQ